MGFVSSGIFTMIKSRSTSNSLGQEGCSLFFLPLLPLFNVDWNVEETADLVTFTKEILNGKLHFLCIAVLTSLTTPSGVRGGPWFKKSLQCFAQGCDKIFQENCLLISKTINNFLLSLFYNWFTFSSETQQYDTSYSTKDLLKISIINSKSCGKYPAQIITITSWNEIQKQTKDKSDFKPNKLKSFLTKQRNKSYQIWIMHWSGTIYC